MASKYLRKSSLANYFSSRKRRSTFPNKLFGSLYGCTLGVLLYKYVLLELSFTQPVALSLALVICATLGIGNCVSSQVRCVSWLVLPSFGGRVGRGVLKAAVITFVISGPIENLSRNNKEVVRVFACTASLTFNMTKARFNLMFKPFSQAIFGIKTEINEVKETIRSVRDISAPITSEIEDEAIEKGISGENDYLDEQSDKAKFNSTGKIMESASYEQEYLKKIEKRCMNQFTNAAIKCRKMFETGYNKCYETVTWIGAWLLCWPMKLDFVCNIAEALGGVSRCDPSKHIDSGFGDGYAYLKHSRISLSEHFKDVKLQYKIGRIKQLRDLRDARDTAVAILKKVETKKAIFSNIMNIIKRVLAFVFLKIIISCQDYEEHYLKDIEFDNIYITKYFRLIDARRKTSEKLSVLPLKKIETKQIVDPLTLKPLKCEKEHILRESFLLVLEMITASTFLLLDVLFFEVLDIIKRHGKIDYLVEGKHDLMLHIKGTGMIAAIIRSLVKGFNIKKTIKTERSNEQCLPRPSSLARSYYLKIFGTYFAIWLMMWIQAYTQRLRRYICSHFFEKREKKRILFLYNETLKRRKTIFKYMKENIERRAREQLLEQNYNFFQVLTAKYPKKCNWLKILTCARKKCLVCEDPEPRKGINFIQCQNEGCNFIFCRECWNDMQGKCLACNADTGQDGNVEDIGEF